ncbi:UV DNA damage repair endonuclease UvsE [Clostridium sp. MSJ-11]|uniref:UV DNA damage repair endonuclease UvsE n=1 Tax=Clostridium mobile TaxID=2841512 RepID=A0ABS6ED37_9CLOT|nr:UV DNA damage repair endonuclease UvsE [Clostridium mobile]MBU5483107.1 UV DNA damage repair endonuclease UvsE [Clostridium mobile]
MKIGYACIPMGINAKTTRSFIIRNFTYDRFYTCVKENLSDLEKILKYNIDNKIYMFRISSDIIPFGSHEINDIDWWNIFNEELSNIGKYIGNNDIRVSMHPGQYTVLNSLSEDIVNRSIKDIEYHTMFLDSLGVNYSNKIVLHMGGAYGDKKLSMERFKNNFKRLSTSAQKRLVLENDERIFNIDEVIMICESINIPTVFDNLHNKFNPGANDDINIILKNVAKTWKKEDGNIKIHYSDGDESKKHGAHSQHVNTENFINYYNKVKNFPVDIMLEVKDKELSAIKCINSLNLSDKSSLRYEQWAKYKYSVMEKDYSLYKECSKIINSSRPLVDFYKTVDRSLSLPYNKDNFKNTIYHTWGYLKDKVSDKEKDSFFKVFEEFKDLQKAKNLIQRLCKKYNVEYLLQSYYFII